MHFYSHRFPGLLASTLLIGMASALFTAAPAAAQGMQRDMPGMGQGMQKDMPGRGSAKQMTTANGTGTVTAVNAKSRKVTLDHGPMPAINWPAMKMEFAVAPSIDLSKVKTGDKVNFTVSGSGSSYTVQSINPSR